MSPEIRALDPFDDAAFDAWHRVYLIAQQDAMGEAAASWQLEEMRAVMQDAGSSARSYGWVGVVGDEIVAAGWMRTPLLDNLELAELDVHVHPAHQGRGIGTSMLGRVEDEARRLGRRVLTGLVGWPSHAGSEGDGAPGPGFARARGYELALSEVQRELALPVADPVLARLAAEAALAHPAYTLRSWVGPVPDDLLQGWAELTSSLATEAPVGELEIEPEAVSTEAVREKEETLARQGRTKYNTVALSAAGEVVAYTDLATTVHEPGRAYQWGTLVLREHRGHRLGVAVKVANLRLLQASPPGHHPPDDVQRRGQRAHDRRQRGARVPPGRAAGRLPEEAGCAGGGVTGHPVTPDQCGRSVSRSVPRSARAAEPGLRRRAARETSQATRPTRSASPPRIGSGHGPR